MSVGVGDRIPDVEVRTMGAEGPQVSKASELLGSGRVVLFAVPGAFTPGCSKVHLPGFVQKAGELTSKGVDKIACIAVNDVFVMSAWGESQGVGDSITMIADPDGEFATAMGLTFDLSGLGLGVRSKRYAVVLEDGVVKNLDVEEGGEINVSSCDAVIGRL